METDIDAISVATAWLHVLFKKLTNSVSVQMSNNLVCKLKNNYFRFVGSHLGFPTSGCIWQHFHLKQTLQ